MSRLMSRLISKGTLSHKSRVKLMSVTLGVIVLIFRKEGSTSVKHVKP